MTHIDPFRSVGFLHCSHSHTAAPHGDAVRQKKPNGKDLNSIHFVTIEVKELVPGTPIAKLATRVSDPPAPIAYKDMELLLGT